MCFRHALNIVLYIPLSVGVLWRQKLDWMGYARLTAKDFVSQNYSNEKDFDSLPFRKKQILLLSDVLVSSLSLLDSGSWLFANDKY